MGHLTLSQWLYYHNVYINSDFVCTCFHKPFVASKTSPPPTSAFSAIKLLVLFYDVFSIFE